MSERVLLADGGWRDADATICAPVSSARSAPATCCRWGLSRLATESRGGVGVWLAPDDEPAAGRPHVEALR